MKSNYFLSLTVLLFVGQLSALYEGYQQGNTVFVSSDNQVIADQLSRMLSIFNLEHRIVDRVDSADTDHLYIISGDLSRFVHGQMPKYYILYLPYGCANSWFTFLPEAIAIWDGSLSSINQYANLARQYCHLPHENYDFLDPIFLPCFLALNELEGYRTVLSYGNSKLTDISQHVAALYCHTLLQKPEIIVEAGVRWGDGSTIPLYHVAQVANAFLIGVDIVDCGHVYAGLLNSHFVQMEDTSFPSYFKNMRLQKDSVEFVFIDTSHLKEHTLNEIKAFESILSKNGALGFHDTNAVGLDPRGVTEGIKEYFRIDFDEARYQNLMIENNGYVWNMVHYPYNNGCTIMKRMKTGNA